MSKRKRLSQLTEVFLLMKDGGWRTLREIAVRLGNVPEASASARLRDFRKQGLRVQRRLAEGITGTRVYEYRVEVL